ncbi:MAG: RNA helicase, partial [Phenylobacterium sp.]|nr:RNA helicase [Phenylobacterium sp.]
PVEAAPAPTEAPAAEDRPRARSRTRTRARPERTADQPVETIVAAPEPAPQDTAAPEPAPRRAPRQAERPIRGVKARDEADDNRNGVRGFGGDTPAFLLRPTPTRDD